MKKVLIFGGIVVFLFVALIVVSNAQQTKKAEGNPFGKSQLDPATLELIDNPLYQNVILPEELAEKVANGEVTTVYFYSSICQYCRETTPRLVPLADDLGVELVQYNLQEFEEGWNEYKIDATPTVVHFENGVEAGRIVGAATDEEFEQFFNDLVLQ
jgi:thiol-disulfide isomerase/thioredoxin